MKQRIELGRQIIGKTKNIIIVEIKRILGAF